jgi:hypothetical protein
MDIPVQRQQFIDPVDRMVSDAGEDVSDLAGSTLLAAISE